MDKARDNMIFGLLAQYVLRGKVYELDEETLEQFTKLWESECKRKNIRPTSPKGLKIAEGYIPYMLRQSRRAIREREAKATPLTDTWLELVHKAGILAEWCKDEPFNEDFWRELKTVCGQIADGCPIVKEELKGKGLL